MTWATDTGSSIVGSLVPTAAEYQSTIVQSGATYGLIKYSFSGSPNLSGVLAGHRLTVAGFTNALNNGTRVIYSANDTTDEIIVLHTGRTSNSLDETGITGTGSVASGAAVKSEPSTAKKAQGFLTPEKISDGQLNWLINDIYDSVGQFTTYASIAAWKAVDRSSGASAGYHFIQGYGTYRYDPTSALIADDETILEDVGGVRRGILEAAHPDAIFAYVQNLYGDPAYTSSQVAELDFPSVSATGATQDLTVAFSYAAVSDDDEVQVTAPRNLNAGLTASAFVSKDGEVTIRLTNHTGGALNPASGRYRITLRKY